MSCVAFDAIVLFAAHLWYLCCVWAVSGVFVAYLWRICGVFVAYL